MNFFEYFNIKKTIFLDKLYLKKKYYLLQKKYHPDFYFKKNIKKKKKYLNKSKKINKIYKIFKNILNRTKYYLYLKKYDLNNVHFLCKQKKKFLIIQFSLYEEINISKKKNILFKKINILYKKYLFNMFKKIILKNFFNSSLILYKLFFFKKIITKLNK